METIFIGIDEKRLGELLLSGAGNQGSMDTKMSLQISFLQAIVWVSFGCLMMTVVRAQDTDSISPPPEKRMTPELLWKLGRLGEAAISPDGKQVAYSVRRFELADNEGTTNLYVTNVADGVTSLISKNWKSLSSLSCLLYTSDAADE